MVKAGTFFFILNHLPLAFRNDATLIASAVPLPDPATKKAITTCFHLIKNLTSHLEERFRGIQKCVQPARNYLKLSTKRGNSTLTLICICICGVMTRFSRWNQQKIRFYSPATSLLEDQMVNGDAISCIGSTPGRCERRHSGAGGRAGRASPPGTATRAEPGDVDVEALDQALQ